MRDSTRGSNSLLAGAFGRLTVATWLILVGGLAGCGGPVETVVSSALLRVPGDFPSIGEALAAAGEGDTILVAPGRYSGQLILSKPVTLASEFLVTGERGAVAATILDGGDAPFTVLVPEGLTGLPTIVGVTIENSDDGITSHGPFNLFDAVVRNTSDGVDFEGGRGGTVARSVFEGNRDDGLDLDGAVEVLILKNQIRNNGDDGIEIRLHPYSGPTLRVVIRGNRISGNGEDGLQLISYDVATARTFLIADNYIRENVDAGIGIMDGEETSEDFRGALIPEPMLVVNNTFFDNSHGITGGAASIVLNNIFAHHSVVGVKRVAGTSWLAHNLFFANAVDATNTRLDWASTVFADPLLSSHLSVAPGSPAVDAGLLACPWAPTFGWAGCERDYFGAAPDIGAFELRVSDR